MSKIEEDDGMVWIEIRNAIAHNGLQYRRGITKVNPDVAEVLFGLKECPCSHPAGTEVPPDHYKTCPGAPLNHAVPYELVRPVPLVAVPAVDAVSGAPIDTTLHKMNLADCQAFIERTNDGAKLKSLLEGEKRNPTFQGGRKKVIEAITNQLAMLAT